MLGDSHERHQGQAPEGGEPLPIGALELLTQCATLAVVPEGFADAILTQTLESRILSWNRGTRHLYGYTPREMIGQPVDVLAAGPAA